MATTIYGSDFGVVTGIDPGDGLKYRLFTASAAQSYTVSIGAPSVYVPTDSYYVFDGSAGVYYTADTVDTGKGGAFATGLGDDILINNVQYQTGVGPTLPVWLFGGGGNDLVNPPDQVINSLDATPSWAYGGGGDDVLHGGGANDSLYGDTANGFTGNPTITSMELAPYDSAADGNDVLLGRGGDDQLEGDGGDDQLYGGLGADTLDGGLGSDFLFGGPRHSGDLDVLTGGGGSDAFMLSYTEDDSSGGAAFWASYFASSAQDFADTAVGDIVQNIVDDASEEIAAGILGASLGAVGGLLASAFVGLVESLLASAAPKSAQDVMVITDFDPRQDVLVLPLQQTVAESLTASVVTALQVPGGSGQAKVLQLSAGGKVYAYVELGADFLSDMGVLAESDGASQILNNVFNFSTTLTSSGGSVGFSNLASSVISDMLPGGGFQAQQGALPSGSAVTVFGAVGGLVLSNGNSQTFGHVLAGTDYVDILSTNPQLIGFSQLTLSTTAAYIHGFGGSDAIYGTATADTLFGDDGDDILYSFVSTLNGGSGVDPESLSGGAGNDMLYGGGSAGVFDGGTGSDTFGVVYLPLYGPAMQLEVDLTAGYAAERAAPSDTSAPVGGTAPFPGTGNDKVANSYALSGIENAIGGPVNDWIKAANGSRIEGAGGADYLDATAGDATLSYAGSAQAVSVQLFQTSATTSGGDAQGDVIAYGDISGIVALDGSANDDVLGAYSDTAASGGNPFMFVGGAGSDTFQLLGSNSVGIYGIVDFAESATENDVIDLRPLQVTQFAAVQQSDNSVYVYDSPGSGGTLLAYIDLGSFNQTLTAADFLLATAVSGTAQAASAGDGLVGGNGRDTLLGGRGQNFLFGRGGDDTLVGGAAADVLQGGAGRDRLIGGGGVDRMDGGAAGDSYTIDNDIVRDTGTSGIDTATTSRSTTLALDSGIEILKAEAGSTSALRLTGNALANGLVGNDGDNLLRGHAGADSLAGGLGNDRLQGDTERDKLSGEGGADVFVFRAGDSAATATGFDIVLDFLTGLDKVDLDTIGAGGLPPASYVETSVVGDTFAAARGAAAAAMAGGTHAVAFVAGSTDGWLFWSTDANNTTIEQAARLNGANGLDAFARTDLI